MSLTVDTTFLKPSAARDRTCYVSGPMRGYPEFNFPAFDQARDYLEARGWMVYSPADLDRFEGEDSYDVVFEEAMRRDYTVIARSGAFFLLRGWEQSTGANAELHAARTLKLRIFEMEYEGDEIIGFHEFGQQTDVAAMAREDLAILQTADDYLEAFGPEAANAEVFKTLEGLRSADAKARKTFPVATGVVDYFPDALVAIAEVSRVGNDQHNPGKPLHWDRSKSGDEADALMRHFIERGSRDSDGLRHSAKTAWRALALLQKEIESER